MSQNNLISDVLCYRKRCGKGGDKQPVMGMKTDSLAYPFNTTMPGVGVLVGLYQQLEGRYRNAFTILGVLLPLFFVLQRITDTPEEPLWKGEGSLSHTRKLGSNPKSSTRWVNSSASISRNF